MNNFINNMTTKIDENLPTILTGVSVVSGIATGIYSVYAGYQIKKALDALPKDATAMDKFKAIAPWISGTAAGITLTAGTAIAANHESGKRLAAAGLVVASTKLDMEKLQNKTKELLGEEKAKEVEEEIKKDPKTSQAFGNYISSRDERRLFRDASTGFFFRSSISDIDFAKKRFNEDILNHVQDGDDDYTISIANFYDRLLGQDYDEIPVHTGVLFGPGIEDVSALYFDPDIEYENGPNMEPVGVISYKYGEPDKTVVYC